MANKSLTDLTARTATADSDLIHVNSGGTDYKQVKSNFVSDLAQEVSFNNTSLITTQCDAIATEKGAGLYFGTVSGYGHQAETGLPVNDHFLIQLEVRSTATMRLTVKRASGLSTYENLKSTTWYGYVATPQRDEITSLNNSLANSLVKNPSNIASYNEFDALATRGGFYAFRLSASFTIGGVALPNYGRGLIMNYSSSDSSFIYVSPDGFWFGFKNSGTWYVKRASTF